MTLDKAERERRESLIYGSAVSAASCRADYLREAHARIEDLEEAYHAARLHSEDERVNGACDLLTRLGFATGHGDDFESVVAEAEAQVAEIRADRDAARLRCQELEQAATEQLVQATRYKNALQLEMQRAEGYRRAAIILRDLVCTHEARECQAGDCWQPVRLDGWTPPGYCYRHR